MRSYLSKNITTTTETTVCSTGCVLHAITINEKGNGYIQIYDGTSATGTSKGKIVANATEQTFDYDITISDSLVIVTNTAVGDITITFSLEGN